MKQRSLSLQSLLTRFIWLCVLPLLMLAVYLAAVHVSALQTQRDNEASDRARNLATALDHDLMARMDALQALSASPLMDDPPRLKEFYNEALGFRQSFGGQVILADTSMRMLFNTRVPFGTALPKLPTPKGHAAAPAVLATGKPAVGDMFFGPIAKEPLVAIAAPVIRKNGTEAILLSIIETSQFQQRLDKLALPSGWALIVLDGKGDEMARRPQKDSGPAQADKGAVKRFTAGMTASYWSVLLEIPAGAYRAPIASTTAVLSAVVFAITLVSVIAGKRASRRLARSITSLTKGPLAGPMQPVIKEVEEVRTILDEAARARDASEEAIRESEERFRHVFESANVGKSITLPAGEIFVNRAFADMLGYNQEELRNRTWQDLTPPEEIEAIQANIAPLLSGEKNSVRFEKRYIHKNGSNIWADVSVAIRRDSNGKPLHFITTIVDITRRKQAENELRLSEERFSHAFHAAPAGMTITRVRDGTFSDVNESFLRMFEFSRDEVIGHTSVELNMLRPRERAKLIQAQLASGGLRDAELQAHSKSGKSVNILFSSMPMELAGETYHITTMIDITERKKAEEELRITNEELIAINRIITTTATTIGVKKILEKVMDEALNITGLEGGTVCLLTPDETLHLAVQREASEATIIDLTTNTVKIGECLCGECARDHKPLILRDREAVLRFSTREAIRGEDIRFHAAFPVMTGDKCLGVLCVFTRTDRKPTERSLKLLETVTSQIAIAVDNARMFEKISQHTATLEDKIRERTMELSESEAALTNLVEDLNEESAALQVANEKLKEVDRLKSIFIASMSHELRTPLNSIIGFSSIIMNEWLGPLNTEQKENLETILRAGKHLLSLINDVIDVSKIEAGVIDMHMEEFDIYDVVDECVKSFEKEAAGKGLELSTLTLHQRMHTDRRRLLQCMMNLLSNAVKFTENGSINLSLRAEDGYVEIEVSDTGIGIKEDDIPRLFGAFVRLESPLRTKVPGTGLGLYLTKKLLQEVLKGEIIVNSRYGEGSKILIRVPSSI